MPDSAFGFGAADWLEFSLAGLLLLSVFLLNPRWKSVVARFASKTRLVMLSLFVTPIALRLLLLPHHPVPVPNVYDEFSHLLVADTLRHFRLANPAHPMHRFFETFFVLETPTYSSIYPLGQGLMLAFGRAVSGVPWTGLLLCNGAFCAFSFWMLRAYVSPLWALLGGILAVTEFGPLNLWTNCYWGGMLPALAGCLVFGSLPRLCSAWQQGTAGRKRDSTALGIGFGLHLLTRPFESALLAIAIALFCIWFVPRRQWRSAMQTASIALLALSPALILTLLQNKQVTGSWTTLPEALSQYQYGVPTTLTIQHPALPHIELTKQQSLEYKSQALMHGAGTDTLARFLLRLEYRVRDYRFFFLPPLYLALFAFLFSLGRKIYAWVAVTLVIFAFGTNLFPYLLVHYLAAVTCLFLLASVAGLKQITRLKVRNTPVGEEIVRVLVLLCAGQFVLWYSIHLFESAGVPAQLLQYETWDAINHGNPERRIAVAQKLAAIPGELLVFVHYEPWHVFQEEWVWNRADIDHSRIVMARDLGAEEDAKLVAYYPRRKVLMLEPDLEPPKLLNASGLNQQPRR